MNPYLRVKQCIQTPVGLSDEFNSYSQNDFFKFKDSSLMRDKDKRNSDEYVEVGLADFETSDAGLITLIENYVNSQKKRLYIKERKSGIVQQVPKDIQVIDCLCLFYASLDNGDYKDRTMIIPKMEYNVGFFWKYKDLLVQGLRALELTQDAEKMSSHLTAAKISEEKAIALEKYFWNNSFKRKFTPILVQFLVSRKNVLLQLQER